MMEEYSHENINNEEDSFEGAVTTGRKWLSYESNLGISPEVLNNENILNFGSGTSNIGKQLEENGVTCNVVDLDLKFIPDVKTYNPMKFAASLPIKLYLKFSIPDEEEKTKLINLKNKILDSEDRKFIQGNGRALPFPDRAFEHVLALWSTYQIPKENKDIVFRELLRVGKTIHISPIFRDDYEILSRISPEEDYDIIACQPQPFPIIGKLPFEFKSQDDYEKYVEQNSVEDRIIEPDKDSRAVMLSTIEDKVAFSKNGSTIVLRRK